MDANNNLDSENQPDENLSDQEDQNQVQLTTITDLDLLVSSDSTNDTTETAVLPTKKEVESRLVSLSGQVERSYGHLQRSQDRSTKTSRASVYNIKSNRVCSRPLPTCGGGGGYFLDKSLPGYLKGGPEKLLFLACWLGLFQ